MDVLAVAPYAPYEGIPHAGGEYLLRHLHALSRHGRVTLLVPGSSDVLASRSRTPAWLDLAVAPLDLATRSVVRTLCDAAYRRLMAAPPMPTAETLRAVRRGGLLERARRADVVELHWPEFARFAGELRSAGVRTPVCVVEHDVDVRDARKRLGARVTGYRRALGVLTSPLPRRRELAGLRAADLILVFKGADEALLREQGVATAVQVIAPWLDPPLAADRVAGSVLFTGAMWRPENDTGARWFLREVWPLVRAQIPSSTLVLAGAGPTRELVAAAERAEGVEVTGAVPSLLPMYARASVFVAPLFAGGGLKFKVPQAMLCGLPVVGTSVALEGVSEQAPQGVLWGETNLPGQMAKLVLSALQRPDEAAAVGRSAADWCAGRWSFDRSMTSVVEAYRGLAGS